MRHGITILFLLTVWFFPSLLQAQGKFHGGLSGGLATSQIHGDNDAGFNKIGFTAGGFVTTSLSRSNRVHGQFEILYINKGSRNSPPKGSSYFWIIRLNYVELPLMLKVQFKKIALEAGVSYGTLINQKFIENGFSFTPASNRIFRAYEVAALAGVNYKVNDRLTINARSSQSIIPIRDYAIFLPRLGLLGGSYNAVLSVSFKYQLSIDK